jgi:hypothetical protein
MAVKKKIRPTYAQRSDAIIQSDIRGRVVQGSPFFDWLTEIRLDDVPALNTEFERGICEGMRRLARQIQDFVLTEDQKPSED